MSSWTRAHRRAPDARLCAQAALGPARKCGCAGTFQDASGRIPAFEWDSTSSAGGIFSWSLDRMFKLHEKLPWKPLRKSALRKATEWLLEHLERTEGLGAIYPAMVNSVLRLARDWLFAPTIRLTAREIGHLADFEIEEGDTLRMQPCVSPVWDTAITMFSLLEAADCPPTTPPWLKPPHGCWTARCWAAAIGRLMNPGRRTGRMGIRIPQRLLSRRGRHRVCADGASARRLSRPGPSGSRRCVAGPPGCSACRIATAAGERSITNNDSAFLDTRSLRRSQRHDRSLHRRFDGARAGISRPLEVARFRPAIQRAVQFLAKGSGTPTAPGMGAGA